MSEPPEAPRPTAWQTVWKNAPRLMIALAVAGVLAEPVVWITGGIRSQMQIDVESLKAEQSKQRADLAVLTSRLDTLAGTIPRSTDVAGWEAHLSRLDAVYEALRDSLAQDRLTNRETAIRVQSLTSIPPASSQARR